MKNKVSMVEKFSMKKYISIYINEIVCGSVSFYSFFIYVSPCFSGRMVFG